MNKFVKQVFIFALILGITAVVGATGALAVEDSNIGNGYSAGRSLYDDFTGNLKGTVGTTGGLLISLVGLYMWIWNQVSWGFIVAIGGGLLTAFPSIYGNLAEGAQDAFKETQR